MKWFKHITDSCDDPDLDDAFTLFKSDGIYVFWRTIEIMAREFNVDNPGVSTFTKPFFSRKFRLRWDRIENILMFYHRRKRIMVELQNNGEFETITLNCPKLKELCDEWTQKKLGGVS